MSAAADALSETPLGERLADRRWWTFPRTRRYLARTSLPGLTGALLFYCASLTPSLLPRVWYMQAVMSGITMALGYGVGVLVGWLLRSLIPWRPNRLLVLAARWSLLAATLVLVPLFGVLGAEWQHQIRELVDVDQPSEARYLFVVGVAILVAAAIVLVGRGIRSLVRVLARLLGRAIPHQSAYALAVLIVVVMLGFVASGVLHDFALEHASSVFGAVDQSTAPGLAEPDTALRSGSPASLVPWATLGHQGRRFVASGPTEAEISRFSGKPALKPIRVYVGLRSAHSISAQSNLALQELERTGAFDRKVLVVATTTGTGWLNPSMIDPLEYMYNGDTGVVAIQYSYLPSWVKFIADTDPAQEAGRDLFDAVYGKWRQLPAGHRPKLVLFGESLGSFGGEAAFTGIQDIRNRTSGVLWVGPTNGNTLWRRFTSGRDPGSPEWRPVFEEGRTVRFASAPDELNPAGPGWEQPRVVYLQNTSDPIVWWSGQLAFHRPDWLKGTHPPGVSPAMHWFPLVTFWQLTADMEVGTSVPAGHGHSYGVVQGAAAWAGIIPPPGWTAERTAELGTLPAD